MIPHRGGLPHSDTPGSKPARGSSGIFAACHVLHRLLAPRHPPDALLSLKQSLRPPCTGATNASAPRLAPRRHVNRLAWPTQPFAQHALSTPLIAATNSRGHLRPCGREINRVRQTLTRATSRTPRTATPFIRLTRMTGELPEPSCAPRGAPEPDSHIQRPIRPRPRHALPNGNHVTPATPKPTPPRQRAKFRAITRQNPSLNGTCSGLETIGIEPMTPCLQSRCSPS